MTSRARNSSPQTDTFDGIQFDDPISPVDESQFDDSSLIADESEDSAFSGRVTDDYPGDNETSIYQADWVRFGGTVASPSPLHCEEGFFTPDNSARDADDVFLDPYQFGEPNNTVNHGILEVLDAFRTAGDSPPAVYPGAAIGDPAAARTNVANNSIQLSSYESPNNYSAVCNYMQLPYLLGSISISTRITAHLAILLQLETLHHKSVQLNNAQVTIQVSTQVSCSSNTCYRNNKLCRFLGISICI
jgi:hypothetical protein